MAHLPQCQEVVFTVYDDLLQRAEKTGVPLEMVVISLMGLLVSHLTAAGFPREYLTDVMDIHIKKAAALKAKQAGR
jgi:hypothetical protein